MVQRVQVPSGPTLTVCMNTMLETATVTTWPLANRVVVIDAAASMEAMIQPPNMLPDGLVSAGIARCRAARSPRGVTSGISSRLGDGQQFSSRLGSRRGVSPEGSIPT
jgi:hypothetical protein